MIETYEEDFHYNPTEPFEVSFTCDCDQSNSSGPKYGCEVCNQKYYSGIVSYHFNSEPNDPNVLECKDKMINEI